MAKEPRPSNRDLAPLLTLKSPLILEILSLSSARSLLPIVPLVIASTVAHVPAAMSSSTSNWTLSSGCFSMIVCNLLSSVFPSEQSFNFSYTASNISLVFFISSLIGFSKSSSIILGYLSIISDGDWIGLFFSTSSFSVNDSFDWS